MTPRLHPAVAAGLAYVCAAACSTAHYVADADREVDVLLSTRREQVLGTREQQAIRPEPSKEQEVAPTPPAEPEPQSPPAQPQPPATQPQQSPPADAQQPQQPQQPAVEPPPPADAPLPTAEADTVRLDLQAALQRAFRDNRDYLSRRDGLYRQGLSYTLSRFDYGPLFQSTIATVWADREDTLGTARLAGDASVSQKLPTGGTVALGSNVGNSWLERSVASNSFGSLRHDTGVSLSLTQPLLRGAGYEVSHESLTQAERDLVYAIRDFELFRENLSIQIARAYFDLVVQAQQLHNERENLRLATFDREKSEALLQVDRVAQDDVFRAKRREIDAQNRLLDAEAAIERARDQFKIQLGMPTATAIAIDADDTPPFQPVRIDTKSAIAAAKHNRLDLITERERLDDSERAVRIAENALLPQLDLNASVSFGNDPDSSFEQALPDRWVAGAGISMEVPLQRIAQRNGLRAAQLALESARRSHTETLDQLELEVENQLRNLRRIEQQIVLQNEQITQEAEAVQVTEIRFETDSNVDIRDLIDARQALFEARNALIRLQADHFVARLTLMRDLGLLFVGDEGVWR